MSNYSPTTVAREIIDRVRGLIARYDVSQAELAVLCDVSQSQFSKIIRGTRPMSLDQLVIICDALAIDLGQLVSEVEDFVADRDLPASSPIYYVEEGRRLPEAAERLPEHFDAWAQAAWDRLHPNNLIEGRFGSNVGTPAQDEELYEAARPADPEPTDEQPSYDDPS
ncbi:transcriptional regulator with XRE-family HTH domain [Microbacterium testaceum]|uniref:helix-turn-helix domain-containing protein n=1 Tax=Microbacterium TaxID=33882 RepID=UPI0027808547|nr:MULTISPECIES: helix-turn-helix transcriptional regulator [Microbacterium]MDQ1111091.1 transcriptional regulator with XRE-family HTH domain [Microbacterium testaceum]MDR6098367.1 transcriptional regulator with XRE-family HTH domain [Microbacterium sp. SORGH_AS_0454]